MDLTEAQFIKARRSGSAGTQDCVECTFDFASEGVVGVRDSKDAAGPVLVFGNADWALFLGSVRSGGFGHLAG